MIETTYPNPWHFSNNDKALQCPIHPHKIIYEELNEIAMGAPLAGQCFLEVNNKRALIYNWSAGPPVWETEGNSFAVPVWTKRFFKGTVQQLIIVDIKKMEITIFKKLFNVLDLRSFDKQFIYGYDSPLVNTKSIIFNIADEKNEKQFNLDRT